MITEPSAAVDDDAGGEAAAVSVPLGRRFFNLKTAASFVVAFVIMYIAFSGIDVDPRDVIFHIRRANVGLYAVAFAVYYLSFPVRALRWQLLLANVGYGRSTNRGLPSLAGLAEIIFLSWFANCIVPAKLGDAYRGYLLKRSAGVSFSRTMGTVLAERVVDMLVLFVLMGLTGLRIFGGYLPDSVEYLFAAGMVLALIVILALVIMRQFGPQVERMLPGRLQAIYARFSEGTLQSFRNLPLLLVLTLAVWAIEAARLWLIMLALGLPNVSFLVVVFISLAASLLTTLPVTPAGLGLVESGVIAILLLLNSIGTVQGISQSLASSTAILDRSISYLSLVVVGIVAYLIRRGK